VVGIPEGPETVFPPTLEAEVGGPLPSLYETVLSGQFPRPTVQSQNLTG
jgi:hypothetical protein